MKRPQWQDKNPYRDAAPEAAIQLAIAHQWLSIVHDIVDYEERAVQGLNYSLNSPHHSFRPFRKTVGGSSTAAANTISGSLWCRYEQ
jgi:hypothetical protein